MLSNNGYDNANELDAFLTQLLQDSRAIAPASLPREDVEQARQLVVLANDMAPDPRFSAELERRLLQDSPQPSTPLSAHRRISATTRRRIMHNRRLLTLAGAAALVLVLFFALSLLPGTFQGAQPVSAAEIVSRANASLAMQPAAAELVYDRLALTWDVSGNRQQDIIGELWQSADGEAVRYQLTDSAGNLLYFLQRNSDEVWRSVHTQPIGTGTISEVVFSEVSALQDDELSGTQLLPGDLSVGWPRLNQILAQRQRTCLDLYCLLGLSLEEVAERATVIESDGGDESVYNIEIRLLQGDSDFTRTLTIDRDTFSVIEILEKDRGATIASLRHLERRLLDVRELSPGFFDEAPQGVEVVNLEQENEEATAGSDGDRVWIISVSPEPGAILEGPTEFEVVVGYNLVSVPSAMLQVNLARPGFESSSGDERLPIVTGERVEVSNAAHEVTVTFTLDPTAEMSWMGPGDLAPWILLNTFQGAMSLETLAGEHFTEYSWTLSP